GTAGHAGQFALGFAAEDQSPADVAVGRHRSPLQLEVQVADLFLNLLRLFVTQLDVRAAPQLLGADLRDLDEVGHDAADLGLLERAEGAPQVDQRLGELVLARAVDVRAELPPQGQPREQRLPVALDQPLEPAGAALCLDARRQPAAYLARQLLLRQPPLLQQD